MKYPVLIHKEDESDYGVTIPDIPGCFTSGSTIDDAMVNVQQAVELYFEGEDIIPPEPSEIAKLIASETFYIDNGFWVLVNIDFSFLSSKTVRVNITVPEYKLAMIDRKAKDRNLSRSALLIAGAESF